MGARRRVLATLRAALALAAVLAVSSCGGGGTRTPAPPADSPPPPGVTRVTGVERLVWDQSGELAGLTFRAYVGNNPVELGATTCDFVDGVVACSSPLPPLADGTHTIAVVAVSPFGVETERSGPITVQKVSARSVVSAASLPDAGVEADGLRMESAVTAADGRTFAAAVVARALKAPVQLASVPDGRLLIADADARVRVLYPGEPGSEELALDARALMEPPPVGAVGLAAHPDFARNRLVYVAFVSVERSDTRLRVVRLREIANTLGEPATIFEATVVASPGLPGSPLSAMSQPSSLDGPRLAFGPDKLLYVLLPQGSRFSGEPAASQPVGAMLRLRDDGRAPADGALSGIAAHPLGFAWHPATDAMWGIVPTSDTAGVIRTLPDSDGLSRQMAPFTLHMTNGEARIGEVSAGPSGALDVVRGMVQPLALESIGVVRLAIPLVAGDIVTGLSGHIIDAVADGTHIYVAAMDAPTAVSDGDRLASVLRLTPRSR